MTDPFVTSVAVEGGPAHDTVRVFVRHQQAGTLIVGKGEGERLRNVLLSERYFGTARPVDDPISAEDKLVWRMQATNWLDVHEVFCEQGAVGRMVLRLLDRIQELEDEHEQVTHPPGPSLVDMIKAKGQRLFIEDVPWFVKDFHVLYKSAKAVVQCMVDVNYDGASGAVHNLQAQLERLAPAYKETEAVRAVAVQRGAR